VLCKGRETLNLSEKITVAPFGMPVIQDFA
jgi:hypothetical protein